MSYTLIEKQYFEKMNLEVFVYEHDKTKALVEFVKNDDTNKTFGIGFKTPPTNSKGMAHIMEHSVLNGSKKYKTREPFMDMASSSLQTFLNAMTFPDKTIYPLSSENDKDFFNLTDVYLDAVFNPRVLEKKEVLDQEGWHYKLDENDQITGISGVVYNEMQGALTDPDQIVYSDFIANLYKNSPYQFEAGGKPSEIYKISYEEFKNFYKDHYHPSNTRIYFYGNLDIDFYLDHLDKEYLSKYDYKKIDSSIEVSENYYTDLVCGTYPASQVEENPDYLLYGFLTKKNTDLKYDLTILVLLSALFNMDSSLIKKQINDEINPENFYARTGYGVRNSVILQASKADGKKFDRFVEIIEDGLKEASKAINKESLKAAFSIFEYGQRDQLISVNRGLFYFLMQSFYKPIMENFKILDYLKELRDLIDTNYYENFIKENFLDNKTKLLYLAKPSTTYNEEKHKELDEYINNLNKNMTSEKLAAIKNDLEKLNIYQNKKDSEEEKASIPVLNIEDVPTDLSKTPREVIKDKFTYIYNNLDTAGLIYVSLYFNVDHLSLEELKYLSLINDFLGSVDTKNLAYTEIDDLLFQNLAAPDFSNTFININDSKCQRLEKVSFTSTKETIDKAFEVMNEFIFNSKFENQKRILEILRMKKSYFELTMYDQGHIIAMNRANSHIDKTSMLKDQISGIGSYLFLKEVIKEAKDDFQGFLAKINKIYSKIFTNALEISIVSSKEDFEKSKNIINTLFAELKDKEKDLEIEFKAKSIKEAILSDANVNYLANTYDIKNFDHKFDGSLMLASSILSNPYLHELIRAKGGAYGGGMIINKASLLQAYSYRDPNINKTLETFLSIGNLTENINLSQRDFENQQIATMGQILRPKSPQNLGDDDFIKYKKENPKEDREILKEIKASNIEKIKSFAKLFDQSIKENNICVFGNRESILKVKSDFDKIIDLND